jgi:hypothetical protein
LNLCAGHPYVGATIPPVIATTPDPAGMRYASGTLVHGCGRADPDVHLGMRRADRECGSEECSDEKLSHGCISCKV